MNNAIIKRFINNLYLCKYPRRLKNVLRTDIFDETINFYIYIFQTDDITIKSFILSL